MTRILGLALLALIVFVVSAVVMYIALLLLSAVVHSDSCGPNCYTDVYLGVGFYLVGLVVCVAVTVVVVRGAARRTSRGRDDLRDESTRREPWPSGPRERARDDAGRRGADPLTNGDRDCTQRR